MYVLSRQPLASYSKMFPQSNTRASHMPCHAPDLDLIHTTPTSPPNPFQISNPPLRPFQTPYPQINTIPSPQLQV